MQIPFTLQRVGVDIEVFFKVDYAFYSSYPNYVILWTHYGKKVHLK